MTEPSATADFESVLERHGLGALNRRMPRTLQVNVGKLCNQSCHHCHVDAGPKRTERMQQSTAERVVALLAANKTIDTVDITGGAPELNENFRYLVASARAMGKRVIVRCNLTVIFSEGMADLPAFYRDNQVELVCSLPCYTESNVDKQRGRGVFNGSIEALKLLNRVGYGVGSGLTLNLVYNPVGAFLPPRQAELEAKYKEELGLQFGIRFDHLLTIANMPINRFSDQLRREGKSAEYMGLLVNHFNPATVDGLMCRDLVSVGWEGTLYDCDFNQMLEMPFERNGAPLRIEDLESLQTLNGWRIATGAHCFGCTAGAGSGCSGALQ